MTITEIVEAAINYRGTLLNDITNLEKAIDIFLCEYFTSDTKKQEELMLLVFGGLRITFENKRGILDFLQKTQKIDIEKEYPKILSEMQDLFSDRKVMAHYILDTNQDAQRLSDGEIRFVSLNNKLDYRVFTKTGMIENKNKINKMIDVFTGKK